MTIQSLDNCVMLVCVFINIKSLQSYIVVQNKCCVAITIYQKQVITAYFK